MPFLGKSNAICGQGCAGELKSFSPTAHYLERRPGSIQASAGGIRQGTQKDTMNTRDKGYGCGDEELFGTIREAKDNFDPRKNAVRQKRWNKRRKV